MLLPENDFEADSDGLMKISCYLDKLIQQLADSITFKGWLQKADTLRCQLLVWYDEYDQE